MINVPTFILYRVDRSLLAKDEIVRRLGGPNTAYLLFANRNRL